MVQRDDVPEDVNDIEQYKLLVNALEDSRAPLEFTPFGATKTAELDVQFGIDPSFGLSRQRYGWYSNGTLFDSTFFSENNGKIDIETSATSDDIARLRSAFPGQYLPHSVAEPGLGAEILSDHIQRDSNNLTSLTHGEISFEIASWSDTNDRALNAHGISFESDATYAQVRSGDQNVEFVKQENWNIDSLDGTGPSQSILKPEDGYIYLFIYSWYGEGSYILAVQDPESDDIYPAHRYKPTEGNASLEMPNMPVQATVENKSTADPLKATIGGMQFTTHGKGAKEDVSRTTEETRTTSNGYIDTNASTTNNAIDPFAEPGKPLISARRDPNDTTSRKTLSVEVVSNFLNVGGDVYAFIFDEYNEDSALTGYSWQTPVSRNSSGETRVQTDTSATDYSPSSDSTLRGMLYIAGDKKSASVITGDSSSRLPLEAATVVTAALPPGSNSTDATPALLSITEGW